MATVSIPNFWNITQTSFQRTLKIVDEPEEPSVNFPVVLTPSNSYPALPEVLAGARELAAHASNEGHQSSSIRKLLDENGGAVYFKSLSLCSAQDFSRFLDALAGEGDHAWFPYEPLAMNVLWKMQAKNVLTVNEYGNPSLPKSFSCKRFLLTIMLIFRGPSSQVISWHSEFSISPSHPAYVVFFCLQPPESGGKTGISSSLAVYDRLEKEYPRLLKTCVEKGLSYPAPHHIAEDSNTFFGNGLYKETAYEPADGSDVTSLSEEEKQDIVEGRIRDLAKLGGWSEDLAQDLTLPIWQ